MSYHKTLVKIVKCLDGIEMWFRLEDGKNTIEREFIARPLAKGK